MRSIDRSVDAIDRSVERVPRVSTTIWIRDVTIARAIQSRPSSTSRAHRSRLVHRSARSRHASSHASTPRPRPRLPSPVVDVCRVNTSLGRLAQHSSSKAPIVIASTSPPSSPGRAPSVALARLDRGRGRFSDVRAMATGVARTRARWATRDDRRRRVVGRWMND